jgi:uncharacterized protein with GYD domain
MVRYMSLISFTDQGIREVDKSVARATKFRSAVEKAGGRVVQQYWAVGELDGCVVFEAPDENTAAALLLRLGRDDNVRTRTMRVFDANEFEAIVKAT